MKSIFGYIKGTSNDEYYKKFIVKRVKNELKKEERKLNDAYVEFRKDPHRPLALAFEVVLLLAILAITTLAITYKNNQMYVNIIIISVAALSLLLCVILLIIDLKLIKSKKNIERRATYFKALDEYYSVRNELLDVPSDALNIDVISGEYPKSKTGDYIIKRGKGRPIFNIELSMYVSANKLVIVDSKSKMELMLKNVKLETKWQKVSLQNWNKKDDYYNKKYKDLLVRRSMRGYIAPGYGRVSFTVNNDIYFFDILSYDFDSFNTLMEKIK